MEKGIDRYLIRRAVEGATITYKLLVAGDGINGSIRRRRIPAQVDEPALGR